MQDTGQHFDNTGCDTWMKILSGKVLVAPRTRTRTPRARTPRTRPPRTRCSSLAGPSPTRAGTLALTLILTLTLTLTLALTLTLTLTLALTLTLTLTLTRHGAYRFNEGIDWAKLHKMDSVRG